MIGPIILCIASMTTFCLCTRGVLGLATLTRASWTLPRALQGMSTRALRVAQVYLTFALSVLALTSLIATVQAFIDLFSTAV
jgi:hypothetical protein